MPSKILHVSALKVVRDIASQFSTDTAHGALDALTKISTVVNEGLGVETPASKAKAIRKAKRGATGLPGGAAAHQMHS